MHVAYCARLIFSAALQEIRKIINHYYLPPIKWKRNVYLFRSAFYRQFWLTAMRT
jgi:hypothetical protein